MRLNLSFSDIIYGFSAIIGVDSIVVEASFPSKLPQ
jgi:hypothetical protein